MTATSSITVPVITSDMSQVDVALALAAAGMHVFPADHPELAVCAGPKTAQHDPATCDKRGKCPVIKWDSGASTSAHTIHYWWSGNPRNVALHTGKSGLLVIDEDGPGEFAKYAADHDVEIPATFTVTTAKGKHYYFADTEEGALGNREGAFRDYAINVRSGNGYVIGPGSMHAETGVVYTANGVRDIAPLPAWIPEAIRGKKKTSNEAEEVLLGEEYSPFELPEVIKEGHRDEVLYRLACSLRAQSINLQAAKLIMETAWQRCDQPPTAKTPFTLDQALAKLDNAYTQHAEGRSEGYEPEAPADESETPTPRYTATDDGNALRLITKRGHLLRRVADMKKWFAWDGQRWALDHEDRAVREAARELARLLPAGTKNQAAFKRNSMSATGVSSCVRLAETDPRVSVRADQLDSHPELINTPSGVVDLRTATVRPHDPSLLLTRTTAYPADLDAPHPRWAKFLADTFPNDGGVLAEYMRRTAGLALFGGVPEHVLPFLWGVGANGKTVFANVLQGLLGEADTGGYALSAPDGFLMAGRDGAHPTEIARLRGARLLICSEQTSGKKFDEAKVKKLTGGDILTGRFMRADFFDFHPSHLTMVLSNHLPAVREGGPAFWRRVRRIPFMHVVPEDQRVSDLAEQLLETEGPAILGWAVRGAADVLASGLRDPAAVLAATEEYRISEDTLASFVRDECLLGSGWWETVSDLRVRYEQHCEEVGAEALSTRAVGMRLASEYGIEHDRLSRPARRIYRGIKLQTQDESDDG